MARKIHYVVSASKRVAEVVAKKAQEVLDEVKLTPGWIRAKRFSEDKILIHCPGCGCDHVFDGRWKFNEDFEKPTFEPSLLIQSKIICHSFVEEGRIRFLTDSTHKLSGQTVELPAYEEN